MEKLELKYLKGYLGTGLKVIDEESGEIFEVCGCDFSEDELLVNDNIDGSVERYCLDLLKPLLIPLSALTETLEDGSVPIVELAKITTGVEEICVVTYEINTDGVFILFNGNMVLGYCNEDSFGMYDFSGKIYTIARQLQLFEYLYLKHFDIHRLIPSGLAIDKRTIK